MKKLMIASVFTASALLSNLAGASVTSQMETMTVTYRNSLDYALYQYTIELMSHYRAEIRTSIQRQAKNSSQAMAEAFFAQDTPRQVALVDFPAEQKARAE
ncbi:MULTISPECIES: hypothetical protein [Shewanella]|uniref:Uncharacterized protein n=1 Tax=Shewanella marisflavi TaxID=260364 RepID=A0ABX5WJQ5_9GAMM|nr:MULTISPECIES: hypothetical protein [Shewanella]QDF74494.1 hypothetical protein FGA12_04565 [Shewanella marisflavi]